MAESSLKEILNTLEGLLLGKRPQLEYALTCFLAGGHLLIEDVPGVGKTTLAKSLAWSVEAAFKRVQFTSDLLPSDLIGVTVFHQATGQFEFKPGPVFTNVLLADEINRANPKTQSALLEAMHDAHISHDGKTEALPSPFFVVATQNSQDHHGTFPLPESQLDRFLMKLHLGYPDEAFEKRVISGDYQTVYHGATRLSLEDVARMQADVRKVHVADELLGYVYQIIHASRNHPLIKVGVSPRGGQALFRALQALSYVRGRDYVTPDDVLELVPLVFPHRVLMKANQIGDQVDPAVDVFDKILAQLEAPL